MRRWRWVLVVAAAMGAALAGFWYYKSHAASPTAASTVRTVPVTRGTLAVTVPGSGIFTPARAQEVVAPFAAEVKKVLEAGTPVKQGDPVVWLDDDDLRQKVQEAERAVQTARLGLEEARLSARSQEQQLEQELAKARSALSTAEMALSAARRKLERSRTLYEAEAVSLAELEADEEALKRAQLSYDEAKKEVEQAAARQELTRAQAEVRLRQAELSLAKAQADLDKAREELAQAVVRAPFAGVIGSVSVKAGQRVAANAPLFTIIDPGTMLITLEVDETDIVQVKVGQEVELSLEAYPDEPFKGKVVRVAPQAVQQNNISIFRVEVEVANPDGRIRAGMTADGEILVAREENVLLVPLAAVQRRGSTATVTVLENGQPRRVPVELGLDDGVNVVVKSGVAEGTPVVVGLATTRNQAATQRAVPGMPPVGPVFGPVRGTGAR